MTHDPMCQTMSHHHPDAYPCDCHFCQVWCDCEHIAKVRADERDKTLDDAINLLEEMHSERVWWNDMLTWCISVNEAISKIDNIRWEKEEV